MDKAVYRLFAEEQDGLYHPLVGPSCGLDYRSIPYEIDTYTYKDVPGLELLTRYRPVLCENIPKIEVLSWIAYTGAIDRRNIKGWSADPETLLYDLI